MSTFLAICRLRVLSIVGLTAFVVSLFATLQPISPVAAQAEETKTYRIGFHLWKPGKIYDEAMEGIRDGLTLSGIHYEAIILESSRDRDLASENLLKLDAMGLDLIYSLSSAGTKIAKSLNLKTPLIATVVNHPASLGVSNDQAVPDSGWGQLDGIRGAWVAADSESAAPEQVLYVGYLLF